ncbi:aldehyde dehydrogenase family protein [Agromyces sp. ISL-38]|uniref:aldehyde dehydrogenase family protein n=1 Tax=Agromyces sp. ISL-38 TaxID=2819107 RepID=UPI001BE99283|nr:aldehyde dehydrogenase family protein [Agromyces sp. ISL-38]MBT2497931.1 aldehyde dehydrogenase family protein [Agromyces sp. ISL-38]
MSQPEVRAWDARTGRWGDTLAHETSAGELAEVVAVAQAAWAELRGLDRSARAALLDAMAAALEADGERIRALAEQESALGTARIASELGRTTGQLRFLAGVVREGAYLDAAIDRANPDAVPPVADLRRMHLPLGVVGVFAASNFPLAFSVAGGDTASALAAGCAVVVKAHPSHPATSIAVHEALVRAARETGLTNPPVGMVFGVDAGLDLVRHPTIAAVGFTGSLGGGQALMRAIQERESPIPFYGELGSSNPIVITGSAAAERAEAIGDGLARALTGGAGQFCTKPGIAFVPRGEAGDRLLAAAVSAMDAVGAQTPLNTMIGERYLAAANEAGARTAVRTLTATPAPVQERPSVAPTLLEVDAADAGAWVFEEVFGPLGVAVRYDGSELDSLLQQMPGSLTASVHLGEGEPVPDGLGELLALRAGRVIVDGFPTGVAVNWSQQHGGPFPAATTSQTSVGAAAIGRFVRAVSWQNAPEQLLPVELRDGAAGVPRRVDGVLVLP